ncbi:putative dbl domain-containing protein [Botrytis fragariae]|uniref:Putative dbl domain-containing protein n=1 Tax=Botrytis fragariae TaxID=1964551 RepID=A0A8H6B2Q9_9HELO|nr:putative dbl domain-containing protein [Botrytis fragariae]KAF5878408.1 putative dbl domain-containing protein [Botrytis fragariae]
MKTSFQKDKALDASIESASVIKEVDTLTKKIIPLRGSTSIGTSQCIKDKFGEEVPALGQKWWSNSTADPPSKSVNEARRCPENCITFDTKYTINYYNEEGVPIESPIEDPIEDPVRIKKLMWNRERASEPADTVHLVGDLAINPQELIKMEPDTLNHPRQSATNDQFNDNSEVYPAPTMNQFIDDSTTMQVINHQENPATSGSFDINSEISHSAVENERVGESFTAEPVSADREKSAIDNSLGNKISNTMRDLAAKGLQVVNDLDEKAAARAQFFDGTDDQYTDDHIAAMTVTRRHDKSSTSSSLGSRVSSTMRNLAEVGLQVIHDLDEKAARHARFSLDSPIPMEPEPVVTNQTNPFEKFLLTIKRRGGHRKTTSCDMPRNRIEGGLFESPIVSQRPGHRKSLSGSSYGFVNNMKSVGTSLASFSIAPRSRTGMSSRHQRTDYSSRASYAGRASEDNGNCLSRAFILDKEVIKRMEQRQGVIEEILSTEKAYLDDVQALIRVFDGLLIAIPILSQSLRKSIVITLKDIWSHNNELYNELVTVVANTNKSSGVGVVNPPNHPPIKGHKRWQSLGEAPASNSTESRGRHIGDPKVAGEIAKVFCGKIPGLFLYESYGIMHSEVMKQIHTSYRTTDEWRDFNQAIRSTEEMIISTDNRENGSRKGRHFDDYFIKPIHRIARYEVLFGRLLEQSPVCDCPESSTTVETALFRLKEVHKTMNSAAGNHQKATAMSRTWLLQDRLLFTSQASLRISINCLLLLTLPSRKVDLVIRSNHLCGVLHACWQTQVTVAGRNITGQYLIALLYEKFFVLAQPSGTQDEIYAIQACIPISELTVEDVDNSKGLQCHTAPHSWKIVFEHISQLFEIIVSACSAKEELEWKSRLIDRSGKQCNSTVQQEMTASLSLDIKPMGTVYGKPGTVARRNSIHRATTMKGQTTIPRSVIVRNTSATVEPSLSSSASQLSINRSQSLAGPHRPTILAPSRTERFRLETLLADVWTRDIIPYPGMGSRPHREHTVRASASSMMRKISHASISSITKRSGSIASLHKSAEDHTATELDSLRPMVLNRQARHNSSDSMPLPEDENSLGQDAGGGRHGSRLAVIIDEKEGSAGTGAAHSTTASPIMARLASFRSKKSSGSLDDSLNSKRSSASKSPSGKSSLALPIVTAAHGEEVRKENVLHSSMTVDGSSSGEEVAGDLLQAQQRKGRNRAMLMEGFKNLFR